VERDHCYGANKALLQPSLALPSSQPFNRRYEPILPYPSESRHQSPPLVPSESGRPRYLWL